jgi:uncharacterized membrane protein YjjP (DUF1212 family)
MVKQYNDELVLDTALLAGCLILENGGETFRAEETVMRICTAGGYAESEVFALPTGIFITLVSGNVSYKTRVKRIKRRSIDLYRVDRTNAVSRALASGGIDFTEALRLLMNLMEDRREKFELLRRCFFCALQTGLFALVYGGGWFDCSVAFVCGAAVQLLSASFSRINIYPFALSLTGSTLVAAITVVSVTAAGMGNADKIIVGGIIPLLPGLAMTNAIRDTIMGDLTSGSARFTEAILTAAGIATGVGLVFGVYVALGGAI